MNNQKLHEKAHAVARLVPPHGDKHWSFQVMTNDLPTRGEFVLAMKAEEVRLVKPYLQGHVEQRWAMVEFWTKDESLALTAAEAIARRFSWSLLRGDFTREEALSY